MCRAFQVIGSNMWWWVRRRLVRVLASFALVATGGVAFSQGDATGSDADRDRAAQQQEGLQPAPDRRADEGEGPFETLVIRGGTLIDGTGAPPRGPVDIVVVDGTVRQIRPVGGCNLGRPRPPFAADHEIDDVGRRVV